MKNNISHAEAQSTQRETKNHIFILCYVLSMLKGVSALILFLFIAKGFALSVNESQNLCPNPDFKRGLESWIIIKGNSQSVRVRKLSNDLYETALEMTAQETDGIQMESDAFTIAPLKHYSFSVRIRRIQGGAGASIHPSWLDENKILLGHEYVFMATFIGKEWMTYRIEAIAPESTHYTRIEFWLPAGYACWITNVEFRETNPLGPRVSIDLMPEPPDRAEDHGTTLSLRLENRGESVLEDIKGTIFLPNGMRSPESLEFKAPRLSYNQSISRAFLMQGAPKNPDDAIKCQITATSDGKPVSFENSTKPFITKAREVKTKTSDLSPPKLPPMNLKLGCYYFPVMLDWDRDGRGVKAVDYLKPKLGYYNEAMPEVADWHIKWAVEHGISFFVFDWYFNQGMYYLNDALEKGFLKSRFANSMEFCVDWCNEGHATQFKPEDYSHESLDMFITTLCERYFPRKNYLRVDGKPVVIIHVPVKIANEHGGWEGCAEALERMRNTARERGFAGVYFVALQNNTPFLLEYNRGGFDAVTAYAYGFRDIPWDTKTRSIPYDALIPKHRECFEIAQTQAHAQGLDYIPTAWVGWDDNARAGERSIRTRGNTPAAFRRMIEMLPEYAENDTRLALFESWNEWGEGSQAEPGKPYGFQRLNAIRDVLTQARKAYDVPVPTEDDIARFNTSIKYDEVHNMYLQRYAAKVGVEHELNLDFNDGAHSLYLQPMNGIRSNRIENGVMRGSCYNNDPIYFGPPMMDLDPAKIKGFKLRMKKTAGTTGQIFWITDEEKNWAEERSAKFDLIPESEYHEYEIDLSGKKNWKGRIRQLRFDPTNAPAEFELDWFKTLLL